MLALILSGVAVALFYYFCIKPCSYWKDRGVKQTNTTWFFGDNFEQVFRLQSFTHMVQNVYNYWPGTRYVGMYQFTQPILLLKDLDLIKQIAVKDFDHFTDHRTFAPENADPLWGKNLIALQGQRWRDMRTTLSPSFTSSKMKSMFVLISECSQNFTEHFVKKNQEILVVEMKDVLTRFTNDVIATTAFGVKVDSLAEPSNKFYLMGKEATNFTSLWRILKMFGYLIFPKLFETFRVKLFSREVGDFFRQLIDDAIKTREEKGIIRPDMINLLMEARRGTESCEENGAADVGFATAKETDPVHGKLPRDITNEDITAQALIFFFAGFESVAGLMCFMAYELAVNQNVQDKLRQEIEMTLNEWNGELTYEALTKMKYMDMVVSESLRKWPNAIATDRVCTKPYTIEPATAEEKPVHIEKGGVILIPIIAIHRDPVFYPDPERFDPERFNDENKGNINPYTYLPFGLGPRNCIGSRFALMEVKIVFFHILSHFEIIPVDKTKIPLELSKRSLNLNAEGGFWLGLKQLKRRQM